MVSLIANTGIQFYKFNLQIDTREKVIPNMYFYQKTQESASHTKYAVEYAYYLPDDDKYVLKSELQSEGFLDEKDKIKEDEFNLDLLKHLDENEYFPVTNIEQCLQIYENQWLPIPYFRKINDTEFEQSPFAWARMYMKKLAEDKKAKTADYLITIAVDTTVDTSLTSNKLLPTYEPVKQTFGLNTNEDYNLIFIGDTNEWIRRHLLNISHNGIIPQNFPQLKYLGQFLYLLKFLGSLPEFYVKKADELHKNIEKLREKNINNIFTRKIKELEASRKELLKATTENTFPDVYLFPETDESINVNVVLDVGNANTFGIIYDEPGDNSEVNMSKVKPLRLLDLSSPGTEYEGAFSMNLAFSVENFGEIKISDNNRIFQWPSLVRLGREAQRLINASPIKTLSEVNTHLSSTKRYLWDTAKSDNPWFDIKDNDIENSSFVHLEDISDKFNEDGELIYDNSKISRNDPFYSRSSMMTFVYMEIFSHIYNQINSYDYRRAVADGNNEIVRRKLKRVIITAPTSIIKQEQIILRKRAEEALRILKSYYNYVPLDGELGIEIVPSLKDLNKNLALTEEKKDWNYDEASVSQILFLYAEINKKFLNKAHYFFNLYGKKRSDLEEFVLDDVDFLDSKPVTIATIDIGGGTTDLMINAYLNKSNNNSTNLKPIPLFWDSFNKAGDDLMEQIVRSLIEVDIQENAFENGISDIGVKIDRMFGEGSDKGDSEQRVMRKNFVKQIAVPIAHKFLEMAGKEVDEKAMEFDEIFAEIMPSQSLISYLNEYLSSSENFFDLQKIQWKYSYRRVSELIDLHFDKLFRQISIILSNYGIDFLLLAGKVTTLPQIRNLIIKYYSLSPNRIITLNSYRIGTWYPFSDEYGYFKNGKTSVAVGALISYLSGKIKKINGFYIDTDYLIRNINSTANQIGYYDNKERAVGKIILDQDSNREEMEHVNPPMVLGYKQLPHSQYPARPIYSVELNKQFIANKYADEMNEIVNSLVYSEEDRKTEKRKLYQTIENEIQRYVNRMPYKITIERDITTCKESFRVEEITDKNGDSLSPKLIDFKILTLPNKEGYWLDTGKFILAKPGK